MRVIAVIDGGISLEGQVCSKIDFSGDEGARHLVFTTDERENSLGKYCS